LSSAASEFIEGTASRGRRFLLLPFMIASMVLFFVDMHDEDTSEVRQLYGFAHLGFFALAAWGLSRLPELSRRPFVFQFFIIMSVVLAVGGKNKRVKGDRQIMLDYGPSEIALGDFT